MNFMNENVNIYHYKVKVLCNWSLSRQIEFSPIKPLANATTTQEEGAEEEEEGIILIFYESSVFLL